MIKARFLKRQEKVRVIHLGGKMYVYLCLNETDGVEEYEDMDGSRSPVHYFEYDYREIVVPEGTMDEKDLLKNPERYVDYELPKEKTLEEKVAEQETVIANQEATVRMLVDCVLEMSTMVYA